VFRLGRGPTTPGQLSVPEPVEASDLAASDDSTEVTA
jgi:hypothetical protein